MPVMGAVPGLETVRERLVEAPTAMGPKLRLRGDACMWDWVPLPVRGTARGEEASELVMVIVPGRAPDAVGVKVRVMGQLAPGASVAAQLWVRA